ncbi:putative lumazine-binding protein [Gammaproteobacteria bacterium MOLA455]|nr:putative lumazine-binding protein [Gammaproteobacteria bacterium MOLA455]
MAAQKLQHFSDHLEIQSVLNLYASAIDKRQWSQLEQVFTPDAVANFIGIGQFDGRQAITDLISSVLCQCAATQHLLGNYEIQVNGDEAHTTCYLSAMHAGLGDYEGKTLTVWGEYTDKLVRTPEGWRITHRQLDSIFAQGDIGLNA